MIIIGTQFRKAYHTITNPGQGKKTCPNTSAKNK